MEFLQLAGKRFLVFGVSNRKSVAWAIAQTLEALGATVVYSVRSEARKEALSKLLGDRACFTCDVEEEGSLQRLAGELQAQGPFDGFVHSIAFANYTEGTDSFEKTPRSHFMQAMQISAFSLVEMANALKPLLNKTASVVSIGISSYVTASSYGYMSPIKSALEGCTRFLAKSFSKYGDIRFNTVNAGPLKTKSSAGIPGYLENYLFAEKLTMRKSALTTQEVANTAVFLLSPASSGINAQGITVNAGMDWNYFDEEAVSLAMRPEKSE
jgi:enoyl-[acyl-carrier protein] reductase I|tara:strand:+ start:939 stop:1745 length:807 start_codon:yes stop_codon:yes gene_type:complete